MCNSSRSTASRSIPTPARPSPRRSRPDHSAGGSRGVHRHRSAERPRPLPDALLQYRARTAIPTCRCFLAHIVAPPKQGAPAVLLESAAHRRLAPLPQNDYTNQLPPPVGQAHRDLQRESKAAVLHQRQDRSISSRRRCSSCTVGTTEEWHIVNVTQEIHDFHIHQLHFLVEKINGVKVAASVLGRQRRHSASLSRVGNEGDARYARCS